jgi:hypothetical protein
MSPRKTCLRRARPKNLKDKFSKEELYEVLAREYKLTPNEISSMNGVQHLLLLQAATKESSQVVFDSMDKYNQWMRQRGVK